MRAFLVVPLHPLSNDASRVLERPKHVLPDTFFVETAEASLLTRDTFAVLRHPAALHSPVGCLPVQRVRLQRLPQDIVVEDQIAAQDFAVMETDIVTPGQPSHISCPDCGGVLNQIKAEDEIRFRCQVGHAFTPLGLGSENSWMRSGWVAGKRLRMGKASGVMAVPFELRVATQMGAARRIATAGGFAPK